MATEPTPTDAEIEALVLKHGATSYRHRSDAQHPAYGFTLQGLRNLLTEFRAQPAPAASPALGDGVSITAYSVGELKVERARQLAGADLWAVRDGSDYCLDKWGNWEWEPMPSSRDDKFLNRCRFATAEEAIAAAHRISKGA